MGYSGRYHAASLAAVFIALAIGILIGIGLAGDVVSSASQEVQDSLRDELDAAQAQVGDLQTDLDRQQQFSEGAFPALVAMRLERQRVALVGLGDIPKPTADATLDAIDTADGNVVSVSTIELPPDIEALLADAGGRFADARPSADATEGLGVALGRRLVDGGALIDRLKPDLFSSFTGNLVGVRRFVVVRQPPDDLTMARQRLDDAFERGVIKGISRTAEAEVGVETTATDPTTLGAFADLGITTVDHVDLPAGKVALVYALTGAEGNFGIKDGASSLLPELLRAPVVPVGPPAP